MERWTLTKDQADILIQYVENVRVFGTENLMQTMIDVADCNGVSAEWIQKQLNALSLTK